MRAILRGTKTEIIRMEKVNLPTRNFLTRTGGNGLAVIGLRESGEDVYSAYMVADAGGGTVKTSVIDCAGGAIPGTILRFADESKCFAAVK